LIGALKMLSIFICYGGENGEKIGVSLRDFLRKENLDPFIASPHSPDIPAGLNYHIVIRERLSNSHIMVPICDAGIHSSNYAMNEISFAINQGIPIIPFKERGQELPLFLQNIWAPVEYDPECPEARFQKLELEIFRLVLFKIHSTKGTIGNKPKELGIPTELLRVSVC